jgi:FtsH-binding integral membrane protein
MSIMSLENIIPLGVAAICVLLLIVVASRRPAGSAHLLLTLAATILIAAAVMLPPDFAIVGRLGRNFALTMALGALLLVFGALLLRDIGGGEARWWWAGGGVWLALVALTALVVSPFAVGERDWLANLLRAPDAAGLVVLAGFLAAGTLLPGLTLVAHDRATLPEVGNRALLWLFQTIALLCGSALLLSGVWLLMQAGLLALLLGAAGATYMMIRREAFDLSGRLRFVARLLVTIGVTALVIAAAIWVVGYLGLPNEAQANALIFVFALLAALVYVPLRGALDLIFQRYSPAAADPTAAARKYSQQITRSLDLRQLAQTAVETLTEVMDARRAGLMLVNAPDAGDGAGRRAAAADGQWHEGASHAHGGQQPDPAPLAGDTRAADAVRHRVQAGLRRGGRERARFLPRYDHERLRADPGR